jgi:hypothetical protein
MRRSILSAVVLLGVAAACRADRGNLIFNGSFEEGRARTGAPDGWTTSGNPSMRQRLTVDTGRDGGRGARLDCIVFNGDGPNFHAMVCQVGKVGVRRGQRYRLTFWAKAASLKAGGVDVALVNTRDWVGSGFGRRSRPARAGSGSSSSFSASTTYRPRPAGCRSGSRARGRSGSTTSRSPRPVTSRSGTRGSAPRASRTRSRTAASSAARSAGAA